MDTERIEELAQDPRFIPGIYNYCDRWCERCPLTSRCMNFALSEEHFSDPESRDLDNEAFWKKVSEIFQTTVEMVRESARKHGIDLDSLDLEAGADESEDIHNAAENHECCRAAKDYGRMVDDWFDSAKYLFEEKTEELNLKLELQVPDSNPAGEAASIENCAEIIRWYQHFIYAKLAGAVRGSLEDYETGNEDSRGSAKTALIAMDRSVGAWGQMGEHFPQYKDDILDILVHLDRLRRKTQEVFPDARAFARPGLDA